MCIFKSLTSTVGNKNKNSNFVAIKNGLDTNAH